MTISIKQYQTLAIKALNNKQYQQAHQYIITILQHDKNFAEGYFLLAIIASEHGNNSKAIQLFKQAHLLNPKNTEYIAYLAKHLALRHDYINAFAYLEKLSPEAINNSLVLDTIGVAYSLLGLHQKSVNYLSKAVSISADNANYQFNLGAALKFTGHFKDANLAYQQAIKLDPTHYQAHAALSGLGNISKENNHIKTLNTVYSRLSKSTDKLYIGHALAREYEALKQYSNSFSALINAKKQKCEELNYSIEDDKNIFKQLKLNAENIHQKDQQGYSSQEPIFVVGMPRTGTTLIERVLSQHTDVSGTGELQNFSVLVKQLSRTRTHHVLDSQTLQASKHIDFTQLGKSYIESTRSLTGVTARFIDKMPLNVLYAGLIIKALPKCKIVCLDRTPLDTVVSNFKQLLSVNHSYYNYAYSLASCAEYYLLFKDLITYWQNNFPNNFYVVNYEKFVNEPEREAKEMFSFCELNWQENCLAIEKNSSPVATPSALQVKQPIHNQSINNWKKFEFYLDEVKVILNNN